MNQVYIIAHESPNPITKTFNECMKAHVKFPLCKVIVCQPKDTSDDFFYNDKHWIRRQYNVPHYIPLCTMVICINGMYPTMDVKQLIEYETKPVEIPVFNLNVPITWIVKKHVEPYVRELLELCMNSNSFKMIYIQESDLKPPILTKSVVIIQTPFLKDETWLNVVVNNDVWILNIEMSSRITFQPCLEFQTVANKRRLKVLDYSYENLCIGSKLIPRYKNALLRLPTMKTPEMREADEDFVVGFIGTMSQRRSDILATLNYLGLKILVCNTFDVIQLNEFRKKCNIMLNIHYDEKHRIFEILRCIPTLLQGCKIISEDSICDANIYMDLMKHVTFCTYDKLVFTILCAR